MRPLAPELAGLARTLARQEGVVARHQLLAIGLRDHDIRRLERRRILTPFHRGVWLTHTGEPTWRQRAWAAVLFAEPAALAGATALRALDGPGRDTDDRIHLALPRGRKLVLPPDVTAVRITDLDTRVLWNASPPRLRVEEAVLDLAAAVASDVDAVGWLTRALHSRRTTAPRLQAALAKRNRIQRRAFLEQVTDNLAQGTCSVLEHAHLSRVQRPHGLPEGEWQRRAQRTRIAYHDNAVLEVPAIVELDGFAFHTSPAQFAADLQRDLAAAADGQHTIRLGYVQVFDRSCETAADLARAWQHLGWRGEMRRCANCP